MRSEDLAETWSRYWRSGEIQSCSDGSIDLAALDSLWRSFFAELPAGAKVIDLATGGGHVLRHGLTAAAQLGRTFDLQGVDLADLTEVARHLPATTRLSSGVDIASLPFGDASFDAVVSQFGMEYADASRAFSEAVRVLKPGGRGQFVLHHCDSAITLGAREKVAVHEALMPDTVFRAAQDAFECLARHEPPAATGVAVSHFRSALVPLRAQFRDGPQYRDAGQILKFLDDLARQPERFTAPDVVRRLAVIREEFGNWRRRQQALIDAALDDAKMGDVTAALQACGADSASAAEIRDGTAILGWCCRFRKTV